MRYTALRFLSIKYSVVNYRWNVLQQTSETYSSCLTETLFLLNNNFSFPPLPQPLENTILHFDSIYLTILDNSCKGDYAVCVLLRLAYFTSDNIPKVYPYCGMLQELLLSKD